MARGRGHRGALMEVGTELNIVPYLDMMTVLVLFLLVNITSFLSFTILNASIPQLVESKQAAIEKMKKEQLLLIVEVRPKEFLVNPSVQGGTAINPMRVSKDKEGYNFARLNEIAINLKSRFPNESRVLIISDPKVIYDDIIHTMDALREFEPEQVAQAKTEGEGQKEAKEEGKSQAEPQERQVGLLFPDVTLSII